LRGTRQWAMRCPVRSLCVNRREAVRNLRTFASLNVAPAFDCLGGVGRVKTALRRCAVLTRPAHSLGLANTGATACGSGRFTGFKRYPRQVRDESGRQLGMGTRMAVGHAQAAAQCINASEPETWNRSMPRRIRRILSLSQGSL
jgi:hypothetical protein